MKKIIVETIEGKKDLIKADWSRDEIIQNIKIFGKTIDDSILNMVFHEISHSLIMSKININDIKSIIFEDMKEN